MIYGFLSQQCLMTVYWVPIKSACARFLMLCNTHELGIVDSTRLEAHSQATQKMKLRRMGINVQDLRFD